ncbi:MAG: signal peptide peptidase SppA [Ignavibacteria bacterium GWF2_33_9]|nr:MAG: signal peptide peptidase SppA [Ignavibacteria bacterium GWF2_33_9]
MPEYNQPFQAPQPSYVPMAKRKRRWVWPVIIIAIILAIFSIPIFIMVGVVSSISNIESTPVEVSKNTVLELNLSSFPETSSGNPFAIFSGSTSKNSIFDITSAIKAAKDDDKVKGIFIQQGMGNFGFAKANEIMNALKEFKTSGKFVYAYLPFASENSYMVSTLADSIFSPSMGFFEINGFGISGLFLKGFFDKLGIDIYVEHFEDFKSAGEQMSRYKFSDSSKKQLRILLEQRWIEFIDVVSKNRNLDKDAFIAAVNRGQYTADSLIALGLIDGISTYDDFKDKMYYEVFGEMPEDIKNSNKKINYISVAEYAGTDYPTTGTLFDNKKKIAIIRAEGEITSELQGIVPGNSNEGITDAKLIKQLKKVRIDKDVKAVIIRINSPGGSALASDNIWQEIMKLRKIKPVYASMSDVAASGGYYISMACDTIVAYPNTITGSIGVISVVPNASGLAGKLGFSSDTINVGNHSQFLNGMYPYSDYDKEKFRAAMKTIYYDFVGKAAKSRNKSFEELRALAKGRVWNGEDALRIGLIDKLGDFQTTIDLAKQRIGCPLDEKVLVDIYPKPEDEFENFINFLRNIGNMKSSEISSSLETLGLKSENAGTISTLYSQLPETMKMQIKYNLKLWQMSKTENIMMVMPYSF